MNTDEKLKQIKDNLNEIGYDKLAELIDDCIDKSTRKDHSCIGIVGNDLSGKSTLINSILEEKILPETVIPSLADIHIKYGIESEIKDEAGNNIDRERLQDIIENEGSITVSIPNDILKEYGIEIKEFHEILSDKNLNDTYSLSNIYNCDAVILVSSAERLLGERECSFIGNFTHFVGLDRILLIVNKLKLIDNSEIESVLKYVKNEIDVKFPGLKWMVYDPERIYSSVIAKFTNINIKEWLTTVNIPENDSTSLSINNVINFVREELILEMENLKSIQEKNKEEIDQINQRKLEQRELEQATIENSLLEFKQRRNSAVEKVDSFVKDEFSCIVEDLVKQYKTATDKYAWYSTELEKEWGKKASKSLYKADKNLTNIIIQDVEWLNKILSAHLTPNLETVEYANKDLNISEKLVPYGTYRKFVPIGIGGGIVIGYCLLNAAGSVISIAGGMLAYSYLKFKESNQDEEVQRSITALVREKAADIRQLIRKEIEKLYDNVVENFRKEEKEILDSKYRIINEKSEDSLLKIGKIEDTIARLEVLDVNS